MSFDAALSHKLAAWNERRLIRDLYDAHFIFRMVGQRPHMPTLLARLSKVESRIPGLRGRSQMSVDDLAGEMEKEALDLTEGKARMELGPLHSVEL